MTNTFLRGLVSRTLACVALFIAGWLQPALAQTGAPEVFGAWYGTETQRIDIVTGTGLVPPPTIVSKVQYLQRQNNGEILIRSPMNAMFGDPLPGQPKVVALFLSYGGMNYNLRQVEGRNLKFPGTAGEDYTFGTLDIVSASYGLAAAPASQNVLNRVKANMKAGVIVVPANMNVFFGGDPAPNVPKQFSVTLRDLGKLYEFRQIEGREFRFPGILGQDYLMPAMATPPTTTATNTPPVTTNTTTTPTPPTTTTTTTTATPSADTELFEDMPDMTDEEIQMVMDWIKRKSISAKSSFCWKKSDPRGVGTIPGRVADCPSGYTNNGATCGRGANSISAPSRLANCPDGYTNTGLTCFRGVSTYWKGCKRGGCADGYTDNGCFCGRGAHTAGLDAMVCAAGFTKGIDGRCRRDCPAGYTNTGETCLRNVSTLGLDSMVCRPGERKVLGRCFPENGQCYGDEQEQAGLCYRQCKPGYSGDGPVCWQACTGSTPVACGAGCAKSTLDCATKTFDQITAPLVIAANFASLGLGGSAKTGVEGGLKTLTVGSTTFTNAKKPGQALIWMVTKLRSTDTTLTMPITRRIFLSKAGKPGAGKLASVMFVKKRATLFYKVAATTHQAVNDYAKAFAEDFASQTSPEVNDIINKNFHPDTAQFLKETWARQQFSEMAEAEGWTVAENALNMVGMVDFTGITSLVGAYANPICQEITPLPCTSANTLSCNTAFTNLTPPAELELKVTPLSTFSCLDNCADLTKGFSAETATKVCGNAAQCETLCGIAGTANACLAIQPPKITLRECMDVPGAECKNGAKPPPFNCNECTTAEGLCANLGQCSKQCNGTLKWGEGQLQTTVYNPLAFSSRMALQANVCFTKNLLTAQVCAANSPSRSCRTAAIDPPPGPAMVADGRKSMIANPNSSAYLPQGSTIMSQDGTAMIRMDFTGAVSSYVYQAGDWQMSGSQPPRGTANGGNYFLSLSPTGRLCVNSGVPNGVFKEQYCIAGAAKPVGRYQMTVSDVNGMPSDFPAIRVHELENVEGLEFQKSSKPVYTSIAGK